MATAHLTVSIQHYSSTGVRVKFLSIQHYYFFLEHEKFQLIDYKKISSIQLFFIYTLGGDRVLVARPQEDVLMRSVSVGEASWYRALLDKQSPDQAAAAARRAEHGCDPMLYWEAAVHTGLLVQRH